MAFTIGVDVGGSHITSALFDNMMIVSRDDRAFRPFSGMDLASLVSECVESVSSGISPDCPVGIGVPGIVGYDGLLRLAPNLGVEEYPLQAELKRRGLFARVLNDANAAAIAEWWSGAGKGKDNVICLTVGTGIGAGVVAHGRLLVGAGGRTGEIGHMVVEPQGPRCTCGNRGCLETLASGAAIARRGEEEAKNDPLIAQAADPGGRVGALAVFRAARMGSAAAEKIIWEAASWLAVGLSNVVAVLDPDVIIVGGGVAEAGDQFLEPVRRAMNENPVYRLHPTPVVPAMHGRDAGVIGAAVYAAQESGLLRRVSS